MKNTLSHEHIDARALESMNRFHSATVSEVKTTVESNEWVVIGMAQNAFCKKALKLLTQKNIKFVYKEYGSYFSLWKPRLAIKLWSGWPTFPQVFHKGKLIGGYTDLVAYLKA